VTYVSAVIVIGLTLIAILGRSPDTRSNFQDSPEGYDRTELAVIGAEAQFEGFITDIHSTGKEIYFGVGCGSCHGLRGEGGVVGPDIQKKNLEDMLDAVREGEHGMPFFGDERLSDEQVEALTEYVNGLRQASQR
jgi:mono/diheme cytochrome c family protein